MRALKPALDPQNISIPERYCRRCRACIDNAYRAANYATANYACRYFKGMAMWWFNKGKRKEIWDENSGGSAISRRHIRYARSAVPLPIVLKKLVALLIARITKRINTRPNGTNAPPRPQWKSPSRFLMTSCAILQIVSLCVKANDLRTARILFRAIQAESIKEDVLNDHPILRQSTTG